MNGYAIKAIIIQEKDHGGIPTSEFRVDEGILEKAWTHTPHGPHLGILYVVNHHIGIGICTYSGVRRPWRNSASYRFGSGLPGHIDRSRSLHLFRNYIAAQLANNYHLFL